MGFALINPCGVLWIFMYVHITVDIDGVMISMLALSVSGTGQDKQKTIALVFAVSPLST
jgi:hypothetical protein